MAPAPGRSTQIDRSLFYTLTPTFREFVQSVSPALRAALHSRLREVRLAPDTQLFFTTCDQVVNLLAIVAEEAPESALVLPIWARVAETGARFDLRVLREAELDSSTLAQFVADAEVADAIAEADLPLLLLFDAEWNYMERWGPHPQPFDARLDQWLATHPDFERVAEDETPEGRQAFARSLDQLSLEMRIWYNSSLSAASIREVRDLIASFAEGGDDYSAEFA